MDFIHANAATISTAAVILINAVLTRCPAIVENDIFQIVGTIARGIFSKAVTPAA